MWTVRMGRGAFGLFLGVSIVIHCVRIIVEWCDRHKVFTPQKSLLFCLLPGVGGCKVRGVTRAFLGPPTINRRKKLRPENRLILPDFREMHFFRNLLLHRMDG